MEPEASQPPYFRMRCHLGGPLAEPVWPDGVYLSAFSDSDTPKAHALLQLAYSDGGGSVPGFGEWWSKLSNDNEYDSSLCFAVRDANADIIGFAQCWTSAFIKDFVIHPQHRGRGIGRALALYVFRTFQARSAEAVDLKVLTTNPVGISFYKRLGMVIVPG